MGSQSASGLALSRPPARADGDVVPAPVVPDRVIAFPVLIRLVRFLDVGLLATAILGVSVVMAPTMPPGQIVVSGALFIYATVTLLRGLAAYRAPSLARLGRAFPIALASVAAGTACLAVVVGLLRGMPGAETRWTICVGGAALTLIGAARLGLAPLLAWWRVTGRLTRHVAVVGANDYSRSFIDSVRADPAAGLAIVGVYDDRLKRLPPASAAMTVDGDVQTLIADARSRRIDVIVVALPLSANERIAQICAQLSPTVADIFLTADTAGLRYDGRDFEALGHNGVIRVASRPLSDWDAAVKAGFDRVVAIVLLVLLSPLLLTVAALVRLDSPGPALFRQPRIGFNNKTFQVLKFRSMYHHLADRLADRQTTQDDHRVTRIGRFLRRTSLDELPQLINVLRGDMSLVGPRPHAPNTKADNRLFDDVVADYALRHRLKPGITGWAQVNGWRGETPRIHQIEQRVAHDLAYIENWSLLLDLKILCLTALRGFVGKQAY